MRDQLTGAVRAESAASVLSSSGYTSSMVAVDSLGRIFHNNSNGAGGSPADLRAFGPTLAEEWHVVLTGMSQGGPSLASDGSLVLAGTGEVRRCRTAPPCATGGLNCDGAVDGFDLGLLLGSWGPCPAGNCPGDLDANGSVDGFDLGLLLGAWG